MEDDHDDSAAVAELGSQVLKVLDAESVTVALHNGKSVDGSPASFALRKKTKKGESSWTGKFSIETESGTLEMDCSSIKSVRPKH
jgi:hypothetical protein